MLGITYCRVADRVDKSVPYWLIMLGMHATAVGNILMGGLWQLLYFDFRTFEAVNYAFPSKQIQVEVPHKMFSQ